MCASLKGFVLRTKCSSFLDQVIHSNLLLNHLFKDKEHISYLWLLSIIFLIRQLITLAAGLLTQHSKANFLCFRAQTLFAIIANPFGQDLFTNPRLLHFLQSLLKLS